MFRWQNVYWELYGEIFFDYMNCYILSFKCEPLDYTCLYVFTIQYTIQYNRHRYIDVHINISKQHITYVPFPVNKV